eukprot:4856023-Amphidinium_carterae.1
MAPKTTIFTPSKPCEDLVICTLHAMVCQAGRKDERGWMSFCYLQASLLLARQMNLHKFQCRTNAA